MCCQVKCLQALLHQCTLQQKKGQHPIAFWTKLITSYLREWEATLASWILCVGIDRCLRLYTSQESPLLLYHLLTCSQHLPFRVSAERLSHFAVVHCSSNTLQEGRGLEVKRGQFSYKQPAGQSELGFFLGCVHMKFSRQ